jgi:Carboxypeptidase regulatory-like domain
MRIVGVISGVVTDPAGSVVPNAKVILTDSVNGTKKETVSNGSGQFVFPDLPFGTFELNVTAPGFQTSVTEKISVVASQTTDVPVALKVGSATESVTVEGTTPVLETTAPLVSNTLEPKVINELPLGARQALSFAALVPGKTTSSSNGGDTRFNNMPGGSVEVTVDGINDASNGYKSGGTVFYTTVPVRLGALEEVSVETSGLGSDAGAESGVNIKFITKRGGNQYHGSAFYQPTSEQFNANTWGQNAINTARAYNRVHNFGGNIGGPLIPFGRLKEKLFFFFNYEYVFNPQVINRTYTVANPSTLAGNYTYLLNNSLTQTNTVNVLSIAAQQGATITLDPVVQNIVAQNAKIPSYATPQPSSSFNSTAWLWRTDNNLYQYYPTTRFDYYITQKEQLTFSWNIEHSWQTGAALLQGGDRVNPFRIGGYFVWNVALQSSLSPTMFNEFRYGVQHSGDSNASATKGYGTFFTVGSTPLLTLNNQNLPFGAQLPYNYQQNVTGRHYITTIYDTLTKVHGNHTITAGGSYRRTDWHDTGETFPLPFYAFGSPSGDPLNGQLFSATTLPGDAAGDFANAGNLYNQLVGRIASARFNVVVDPATKQYGGFINHTWTRTYMGGLFAQDRWRISPNLTVNFGLRWEGQGDMYDPLGTTAIPNQAAIYGPSVSLFTPGLLSSNTIPTASIGLHPYKPDYLNFAPNVGFAWNPKGTDGILGKLLGSNKTVIRGSYGVIYYDEGTQLFAQNLGNNPGKTANQTIQMGQSGTAAFTTLSQVIANPLSGANFTGLPTYSPIVNQANQTFSTSLTAMKPTLVAPYTTNWSIGIQRELAKATVLEVRYVGNQGHRAWRTSNLNEVNIFENGFLKEFQVAQNNLAIANGLSLSQLTALPTIPTLKTTNFAFQGLPGQGATPILDAAFGPRGTVPAIAAASGYSSSTFAGYLQTGAAGSFARSIATSSLYFCRMMGSSFSPCTQARSNPAAGQAFNAPGAGYPINFFTLNPYSTDNLPYVDDSGWSSYNGLQVQLRKQFSHGLNWTTNFSYSKSLSNLLADSSIQNQDYYTWRNESLNRQPALFDQKFDLQTFGTYDLPIGKGKKINLSNHLLDSILGGWTAGSVVEFNTGTPVQLTGGANTFNNQASGVTLAPGVTLQEISDMFRNQPLLKVDQTGNANPLLARANALDTTRIGVPLSLLDPATGKANSQFLTVNNTPGSLGQILWIYSKNNINWNASMTKNFHITERVKFQLYADANNLLNHPSWGLPNTNAGSTSFGTLGSPSGSNAGGYRTMTFRGMIVF